MEHRYGLRFETGERAGETIPIGTEGFTVGRKPGNSLQILDNSVSGKHAEILLDARGALLRDLGSTNGTRVAGERVLETVIAPGDRIAFGNVVLVFLEVDDLEVARPAASMAAATAAHAAAATAAHAAGAAAPAAASSDTLLRVSPEVLAKSRKRPVAGLVGLAVLLLAAGGLWYAFGRPSRSGGSAVRPARAAADNLLGDEFSFESETDGWTAGEGAPTAFVKSAQARVSGALGILGDLSEGGWALHRSREVRADSGRALAGSARVKVEGGAVAQVGIELVPPEGADAAGAVVAWSKPFAAPGEVGTAEVATLVPPGYETARLLILGRGAKGGTVAADDASLAPRDSAGPAPLADHDWQLALLGDPPAAAVLSRFGRALATGIAFADGPEPDKLAQAGTIAAAAAPGRITISSARPALALRAEAGLVRAGLATVAAGGYSAHGLDFEREAVTSLLLGKGAELVRLGFSSPVSVKGTAEGPASRIQVRAASGPLEVVLQLDFAEDRKKAGDLAYAARNAEKKGDLGECLKQWADLLNGFPYEEQLVAEADAKRASLVQQGLTELQGVHEEIERARFFRLLDLYRQCKAKALAIGARFQGSEVDLEAQKVAQEVDQDLAGLEADLAKAERARLESILAVLDAQKAEGLAAEVRAHLEKMPKRPPEAGSAGAGPRGSDH
jgi:hypothetical protein